MHFPPPPPPPPSSSSSSSSPSPPQKTLVDCFMIVSHFSHVLTSPTKSVRSKCQSTESSRDSLRPGAVRAASLCHLDPNPGHPEQVAHTGGGLVSPSRTAVLGGGERTEGPREATPAHRGAVCGHTHMPGKAAVAQVLLVLP